MSSMTQIEEDDPVAEPGTPDCFQSVIRPAAHRRAAEAVLSSEHDPQTNTIARSSGVLVHRCACVHGIGTCLVP